MCSVNSNLDTNTRCMCNNTTKFDKVIKACCIVSFLLLLSLDVQSQDMCDRSISGKIIDNETQNPLSDVIIRVISDPQVYGNRVLYNSSDKYEMHICGVCGMMARFNDKMKIHHCKTCGNRVNFKRLEIPYAFKLLTQELVTMNIAPRIITEDI